jgi:hypothetical protein
MGNDNIKLLNDLKLMLERKKLISNLINSQPDFVEAFGVSTPNDVFLPTTDGAGCGEFFDEYNQKHYIVSLHLPLNGAAHLVLRLEHVEWLINELSKFVMMSNLDKGDVNEH